MQKTVDGKVISNEKVMISLLGFLTAFGPLSIDMYLPALPIIAKDLHTDLGFVQLSLSAYFIGLALGQLFYGPYTDKVGRKKPLYIGMAIYALASLVCAFAPNIEVLIGARVLQALGACAGVVITRAVVRDVYDKTHAARIFSVLILIMGVAPILAPLLGGQLVVNYGWRFIFYALFGISMICLTGLYYFLPETHKPVEKKKQSIFKTYLEIITHRNFLQNTFSGAIAQSGMYAYITGSSLVFIEIFGVSTENFGFVFGINAVGLIVFSQVNSHILKSTTPKAILNKVFPILAIIGVCLIIAGYMGTELWHFWIPIFCFMACLGMTFPNTTAEALHEEGEHAGSASAVLGTIQYGIGATISAIMSVFSQKSTLPLAIIMGSCAIVSFIIYVSLAKRGVVEEDFDEDAELCTDA